MSRNSRRVTQGQFNKAEYDKMDMRGFLFPRDCNIPELLDEWLALKEQGERFNKLDKIIKEWVKKKSGAGLNKPDMAVRILLDGWVIEALTTKALRAKIPQEIRERFAKPSVIVDQRFVKEG